MFNVIMAGGEGSRLWPLSTPSKPKPLLEVIQGKSLLELTIERHLSIASKDDIYIAIPEQMAGIVQEKLSSFPVENMILEPSGRNTAACIALAARRLSDKDANEVLGVFPADHVITNHEHFCKCVRQAKILASKSDKLVLLGLKPKEASAAYGYICLKQEISNDGEISTYLASGFREKPDLETAQELLKTGEVLWNSGIYIGKVSTFLEEIKKNIPDVYYSIDHFYNDRTKLRKAYQRFPAVSIDYAVTEKMESFIAISTDIQRIDVGNFDSLFDLLEKDDMNNAASGEYIAIDSRNNVIHSQQKPIALMGINDMIIIDADDAILVCPRKKALAVRRLQERWKKKMEEN